MKARLRHHKFAHVTLNRSLVSILRRTQLCSMATVGPSRPFINNAFFCFDSELDIFFISDPRTHHGRNLARNSLLAMSIADSHQKWDDALRGCQLLGRCRLANATESQEARKLYGRRFPAYGAYQAGLTEKEKAASPHVFYRFRPVRVKLLDVNRFGDEVFIEADITRDGRI